MHAKKESNDKARGVNAASTEKANCFNKIMYWIWFDLYFIHMAGLKKKTNKRRV